jgi:hypothetical protein
VSSVNFGAIPSAFCELTLAPPGGFGYVPVRQIAVKTMKSIPNNHLTTLEAARAATGLPCPLSLAGDRRFGTHALARRCAR